MKKIYSINQILILLTVFLASHFNSLHSQDQKKYLDKNSQIMNFDDEVITPNESWFSIDSLQESQIEVTLHFKLEIKNGGYYYLGMWANGFYTDKGLVSYDIRVDNSKSLLEKVSFIGTGWQNVAVKGNNNHFRNTLFLTEGSHVISFSIIAPDVPKIETIVLSKNQSMARFSTDKFNQLKKQVEQSIENAKNRKVTSIVDSTSTLKGTLSNPSGEYNHYVDLPFSYTYYQSFYFSRNDNVIIGVKQASPYSYHANVIELFKSDDPSDGSWVAYGQSYNDGTHSYPNHINVSINKSGYYILRVRSWQQGAMGYLDIYKNHVLKGNNAIIGSNGVAWVHTPTQDLNYFTSKLSSYSDTRIWIESTNGFPGTIVALNDDYNSSGDHNWGLSSRVNDELPGTIRAVLVSAYGTSSGGNCDLYSKCKNSEDRFIAGFWPFRKTLCDIFDNLEPDDAIEADGTSDDYNCASWGGGRDDLGRYFWASYPETANNLSSPWYEYADFWGSWENFFENSPARFTGAPDYTRTGATSSNAEVAMWGSTPATSQLGHVSVRKPGNNQPHGYDWESKCGGYQRVFHPRDAVGGEDNYGSIQYYWKRDGSKKSYSFEESVKLGLTVNPSVSLTNIEKHKIESEKELIPLSVIDSFDIIFDELIIKANSPELMIQSNPNFLFNTNEYKNYKNFCNRKGKMIWPLLFREVFDEAKPQESEIACLIVNAITPDFIHLMKQVKKEWEDSQYTESGSYIAPSPLNNTKNYIKKLLAIEGGDKLTEVSNIKVVNNNNLNFHLYPNPFKYETKISYSIEKNAVLSISIYDLHGRMVQKIIDNENVIAGNYNIDFKSTILIPGLYVCKLDVGENSYSRKFLIED